MKDEFKGVFSNNEAYATGGDGFRFEGGIPPGLVVENNVAHHTGGHGFNVITPPEATLQAYDIPPGFDPQLLADLLERLIQVAPPGRIAEAKASGLLSTAWGVGTDMVGLAGNVAMLAEDSNVASMITWLRNAVGLP